jgi:hypothetical protein
LGNVTVPANSSGWQDWVTTEMLINLGAGDRVIRLVATVESWNINYFDLVFDSNRDPVDPVDPVDPTDPAGFSLIKSTTGGFPLDFVTTATNNGDGTVTISMDAGQAFGFVWFYNPGWNNMNLVSGTRYEVIVVASPGTRLEWYFLFNNGGAEANDVAQRSSWVVQ